jgi:UDP-4-amino-4,6-dideoxy-N-acetyl-beta-L-altrosamine transaminase
MTEPYLPYGHQTIEPDDLEAVARVFESDFLTTGAEVEAFEADLVDATGAREAAVLNSGTSALHAAYAAIGLGPGGEIVTSPMTFAATGNAALYLGARPVFVDIDPRTGLIDPALVDAAVTSRTRAIVAIDYTGQPADYDALRTIAGRHGIPLVADAAHSLGATDRGRRVGQLADVTVLSFHPVKLITTGEGGAVLTSSVDHHTRVREFRSHGLVRDPERMREADGPWSLEMHQLGFNYRLTDIQCALGRSQLRKLPRFLARRRAIADRYSQDLGAIHGLGLPERRPGVDSAWHLFVVLVNEPSRRRPFFEALRRRGLGVQVHFLPVYRHPYYQDLGYQQGLCRLAEDFYSRVVSLPIYPGLTESDLTRVVETVDAVARETLA